VHRSFRRVRSKANVIPFQRNNVVQQHVVLPLRRWFRSTRQDRQFARRPMASPVFRVSNRNVILMLSFSSTVVLINPCLSCCLRLGVPNVSDRFPTDCSTSSKVANTASTIFKYYLLRVVANVANSLLDVSLRQCLLHGIPLVSVVQCATKS